jgi:hypothetical protein
LVGECLTPPPPLCEHSDLLLYRCAREWLELCFLNVRELAVGEACLLVEKKKKKKWLVENFFASLTETFSL